MGHLWDALGAAYDALGFDAAAGGDEVFRQLVLARIIEPTSKARQPAGAGRGRCRRRRRIRRSTAACPATPPTRGARKLAAACAAHAGLGPTSLVLFDVSTLYFETDAGDGFREPGFSKERRLEPQITIGLLTDASGFPLMVEAFEGNRAETTTMLPTIRAFMAAHRLADVTIVADAGMVSEANKRAIEAAGLSFILGARIPDIPYAGHRVAPPASRRPDARTGSCSTQPRPGRPARPAAATRSSTTSTRHDRARRTLRGIDEQVTKAEKRSGREGAGQAQPVHRAWSAATRRSTAPWRPRPARWPGGRATSPTSPPAPTAHPSPPSS